MGFCSGGILVGNGQWWHGGHDGGAMLEVEGACELVRPTDTSGDKLLMKNWEWVRTKDKHKERNGMVRQNKWGWKIKEWENTEKEKTKMKVEDKGMEESKRRWKVKVWRSLKCTYDGWRRELRKKKWKKIFYYVDILF